MVQKNICFLLNSFIKNIKIENIVFVWVMHQQEIIDELLAKLDGSFNFYSFSLISSRKELAKRFLSDVNSGIREEENLENALSRIKLYNNINSIKIDVTGLTVEQTANKLKSYLSNEYWLGKIIHFLLTIVLANACVLELLEALVLPLIFHIREIPIVLMSHPLNFQQIDFQ